MTPEQTKSAAAVMVAWAEKKQIQARRIQGRAMVDPDWSDCMVAVANDSVHMNWNWDEFTYRIKPEPSEWWIVKAGLTQELFSTKEGALDFSNHRVGSKLIHVKEVV